MEVATSAIKILTLPTIFQDPIEYDFNDRQTKKSTKGRVQKIKMEIYGGICHEGGGGSRPVSSATYLFWKMIFVKNHLESFPDCENVFCT